MARVLGAIRQSKTRDRAISPETQRNKISAWAQAGGHSAIFTEDLSRAGKLSPFKRPALGPYLTKPELIDQWDILVTAKLDRANRNTRDYLALRDWCRDHDKAYVSIAEALDDTTAAGRAMATVVAAFAEFESDRASERRIETMATLQERGRWTGGPVPYGWRADKQADGYFLVPDDDGTAETVRRMARDAIDGTPYQAITRWLNSEHVPTANGVTGWSVPTVRRILRSPRMAALLTEDDYSVLHREVNSRKQERGQWTSGRHELLRVAFCIHCKDKPLYGQTRARGADRYCCSVCKASVRKDVLEAKVEAELIARWGNRPYLIHTTEPGDDNSREIARLERQLATARELEYVDTSGLEAKIAELQAAPFTPDREVVIDTHETIAEHWNSLATPNARNAFLRANGVRAYANRDLFIMDSTAFARWDQQ